MVLVFVFVFVLVDEQAISKPWDKGPTAEVESSHGRFNPTKSRVKSTFNKAVAMRPLTSCSLIYCTLLQNNQEQILGYTEFAHILVQSLVMKERHAQQETHGFTKCLSRNIRTYVAAVVI